MPVVTGKTTGSSFTGPSVGPFGNKGGGGQAGAVNSSAKTTAPPPATISTTFKQQVFNIICTGMKPNTIHKFYYEGVDRGIDCIPVNPKPTSTNVVPGSELKTDNQGTIEFNFYFTLDVERQVDASNKMAYEVAGDKKFELRATDSSAYKIVPFTKITNDLTAFKAFTGLLFTKPL
jgi:hypothetical protein